jgi:hypothetical protein
LRLFLYGTLLEDATLTRHGGDARPPARVLRRLAAYEGPTYRRTRVVVQTATGKTAAQAWIAAGGTRRTWRE